MDQHGVLRQENVQLAFGCVLICHSVTCLVMILWTLWTQVRGHEQPVWGLHPHPPCVEELQFYQEPKIKQLIRYHLHLSTQPISPQPAPKSQGLFLSLCSQVGF